MLLSSESHTGTATQQMLKDSTLNTLPTEINGVCQDMADCRVMQGTSTGEAKQNLMGIPGGQSTSLSFLDLPLSNCTSDLVKVLPLNCTGEARTFLQCWSTLNSSLCCNQTAFLKSSLPTHNICIQFSLQSISSPDKLVTSFPHQVTTMFRSSSILTRVSNKNLFAQS